MARCTSGTHAHPGGLGRSRIAVVLAACLSLPGLLVACDDAGGSTPPTGSAVLPLTSAFAGIRAPRAVAELGSRLHPERFA